MLLLFLSYLILYSDLVGHAGKQLDKKVKFRFKIYVVTDWKTNNGNTHIA